MKNTSTTILLLFAQLLFIFAVQAQSSNPTLIAQSNALSPQLAESFGRSWVLYNNRICPLNTVSIDFTLKITGKTKVGTLTSDQFLSAWCFFPTQWYDSAVISIKEDARLQHILGTTSSRVSYRQFFTPDKRYKLAPYQQQVQSNSANPFVKALTDAHDKVTLIAMMQSGSLLQLFPCATPNGTVWLGASGTIPSSVSLPDSAFIRSVLPQFFTAINHNAIDSAQRVLAQLAGYQRAATNNKLPSTFIKNLEIYYNHIQPFRLLFICTISLGTLSLLWMMLSFFALPNPRWITKTQTIALLVLFLALSAALVTRTAISGHIPLGNGYEIMLCTAWAVQLLALLLQHRSTYIVAFSLFLSGIILLTASLGMKNPPITPLVPVLNSFWLNVHVSCMMLAYSAAGLVSLSGLVVLLSLCFAPRSQAARLHIHISRISVISNILLYPALFFMGTGIFLGAVWANISWGRYWGWDPKETWALITFLVYAFLLHRSSIRFLQNQSLYHALSFLSFASVLMTFFGVNHFLGGMHSYGGQQTDSLLLPMTIALLVALSLISVALIRQKYILNKK